MIVFIGLILALCFVGAWIALTLERSAPQPPSQGVSESNENDWWSQVEAGPDSIEANASDPDVRS